MAIDLRYEPFWRDRLQQVDWGAPLKAFLAARVPLAIAAKERKDKSGVDVELKELYSVLADLARTQQEALSSQANLTGITAQGAVRESAERMKQATAYMQERFRSGRAMLDSKTKLALQGNDQAFQTMMSAAEMAGDREALNAAADGAESSFRSLAGQGDVAGGLEAGAAQLRNSLAGLLQGVNNVNRRKALIDGAVERYRARVGYGSMNADEKAMVEDIVSQHVYNRLGEETSATADGKLTAVGALMLDKDVEGLLNAYREPVGGAGGPAPANAQVETFAPSAVVPVSAAPVTPATATVAAPAAVAAPVVATTQPVAAAPVATATPIVTTTPVQSVPTFAPGGYTSAAGIAQADPYGMTQGYLGGQQALNDRLARIGTMVESRIAALEKQRAAEPVKRDTGEVGLDLMGTRPNPEQARFDAFTAKLRAMTPEKREAYLATLREVKRAKEAGKLGEGKKDAEARAGEVMADWTELDKMASEWSRELATLKASQADRKVEGTPEGKKEVGAFMAQRAAVVSSLPEERRAKVATMFEVPAEWKPAFDGLVKKFDQEREAKKAAAVKAETESMPGLEEAAKKALKEQPTVTKEQVRAARVPEFAPPTPQVREAVQRAESVEPWDAPAMADIKPAPVADPWLPEERARAYDLFKAKFPGQADAKIQEWESLRRTKAAPPQEPTDAQP